MPDNTEHFKRQVRSAAELTRRSKVNECYGVSNSAKVVKGGFVCGIPNLDNLDAGVDSLCVFSKIQLGPSSELHIALFIKRHLPALRARLTSMLEGGNPIFGPRNQNCALFLAPDGKIYPHNKSKETPELDPELLAQLGPGVEPDHIFWAIYGNDTEVARGPVNNLQELASIEKLFRVSVPVATTGMPPGINLIFFGPPGTGKSHLAELRSAGAHNFRTLFHPEYTYHDFLGVYRPVVGEDKTAKITPFGGAGERFRPVCYFEFVPGPLVLALKKAFETPSERVVLIIDEINRGDCAAIFGDVFQLLDRNSDGTSTYGISIRNEIKDYFEKASVPWEIRRDGKLYFPRNFTLLATMNTSDQSLYPMDSAFKRRWQWESCKLDFLEVKTFLRGRDPVLDDHKNKWNWSRLVENLNKIIARSRLEDKMLGPWFIAPREDTAEVDCDTVRHKCLFYLWHDVFKDEQTTESSPFKPGIDSFQVLQSVFERDGAAGAFKDAVTEGAVLPPAGPTIGAATTGSAPAA